VPSGPAEVQLSFAPVVRRVAPAVVNVYAARVIENRNPFMNDPFFRQFFGAVPREQVQRSLGSGVIVDSSGYIVTNHHVVEGAERVRVMLNATVGDVGETTKSTSANAASKSCAIFVRTRCARP